MSGMLQPLIFDTVLPVKKTFSVN